PHFHLRHPIKNFARVEIAENAPLKFQQQRRMNGVRQIEQDIRSAEALEELAFGNSDALPRVQVVRIRRRLLVKQTIPSRQSVRPQLTLKISDPGPVRQDIVRARQVLQPDRIELQSPEPEYPLQRYRKVSAAFAILRRKAASQKDCHASRI